MAVSVVQSIALDMRSSSTTQVTFGSAVVTGNLLIAFFAGENSAENIVPINGWNFGPVLHLGGSYSFTYIVVLYRYAESGDGASPPAPLSGIPGTGTPSSYLSCIAYEISGAASSWADALDSSISGYSVAASTLDEGTLTVSNAPELVLTFYAAGWILGSAPSIGSPWTQDHSAAYFARGQGSAHQAISDAGSAGGGTITWASAGGDTRLYLTLALSSHAGSGETMSRRRWVAFAGA
jgi:hypothetical protein